MWYKLMVQPVHAHQTSPFLPRLSHSNASKDSRNYGFVTIKVMKLWKGNASNATITRTTSTKSCFEPLSLSRHTHLYRMQLSNTLLGLMATSFSEPPYRLREVPTYQTAAIAPSPNRVASSRGVDSSLCALLSVLAGAIALIAINAPLESTTTFLPNAIHSPRVWSSTPTRTHVGGRSWPPTPVGHSISSAVALGSTGRATSQASLRGHVDPSAIEVRLSSIA